MACFTSDHSGCSTMVSQSLLCSKLTDTIACILSEYIFGTLYCAFENVSKCPENEIKKAGTTL